MHRSGTTLLTKLLQSFDVHFGLNQDVNSEATFFLKRNEAILKSLGFDWSEIKNFKSSQAILNSSCNLGEKLLSDIRSPAIIEYLGIEQYLRFKSLQRITFQWGWKDPRNTILLPLWLNIFPNAKIINVIRNGVDVANSLVVRENKRSSKTKKTNSWELTTENIFKKLDYIWVRHKYNANPYTMLTVNLSIERAFQIWVDYLLYFQYLKESYNFDVFTIRYEDLLSNPRKIINSTLKFAGIDNSIEQIKIIEVERFINKGRGYAFVKNPELVKFYRKIQNHPLFKQYGYDSI